MKIPYGKQSIEQADIETVVRVLQSDLLTQGPEVERFETEFAKEVGARYAVAVTNGTAGLHLAALALKVKPGSRVLCTPLTFVASSNAVLYCGGDVEFVDIDARTYCLDLVSLRKRIEAKPQGYYSGIVSVDFAGYPAVRDELSELAKAHGLWILEDACHAVGASYIDKLDQVQKVGNCRHSDISVFSFHPVKHIATGEGGMITTNDLSIYEELKLLRTHGITKDPALMENYEGGWYYEMQTLGFNYRISDILCALGRSQLTRLSTNISLRQKIAQKYMKSLEGIHGLQLPQVDKSAQHGWHLFVIQTDRRKELYDFLKTQNILAQVHYIPVHSQPFYIRKYGRQVFPVVDAYYQRALSLPMYHSLEESEQGHVIASIREFFGA